MLSTMKKSLVYFIATCAIVVIGAIIAAKTISDQHDPFFDDNIEALTDLELNKPIWKVEYISQDDYTCDPDGTQVCFTNE